MASILFVVRKLEGGGAERQLILLARGLQRLGHDVTISVWMTGGPYEAELQGSGIRHLVFEKHGPADFVGFLRRVRPIVRKLRPDVIHGYLDTGNLIAAMLRHSSWEQQIVWGVRASELDLRDYDPVARLLRQINRVACRLADVIIANSHAGASHAIAEGYPAARVRVIPNGIDTERFRPFPDRASALRESWQVRRDERLVGLTARLDPMKDQETFVAAAKILAVRRPEVRFFCVGEGVEPYRSAALATLRSSGLGERMQWKGFVTDIPAFYSALDVATSSSRYGEGFSNAIGEAMACGVPCVVTDVGDSRLIVGNTGLVVPVLNPEALAAGWDELLDRTGPQLSERCRARIVETFSVTRLVTDTENAILPPGIRRMASRTASVVGDSDTV